jgi:hypothetical protein
VRPFVGLAEEIIRKGEQTCLNTQTIGHWPTQTIKQSRALFLAVISLETLFQNIAPHTKATTTAWAMQE